MYRQEECTERPTVADSAAEEENGALLDGTNATFSKQNAENELILKYFFWPAHDIGTVRGVFGAIEFNTLI